MSYDTDRKYLSFLAEYAKDNDPCSGAKVAAAIYVKNTLIIGLDVLFNDFKNGAKQLHRTMLSAGKIIPKDLVSGSSQIYVYKSEPISTEEKFGE